MKKKMLLAVAVFALIFSTAACGQKKTSNNNSGAANNGGNTTNVPEAPQTTANTNAEVISGTTIDGLRIGNISLISTGEHSTFTADVVNTTSESIDVKSFDIILRDASGQVVVKLLGYVGNTILPNNGATINASTEKNLSSVTSVEYVRNY